MNAQLKALVEKLAAEVGCDPLAVSFIFNMSESVCWSVTISAKGRVGSKGHRPFLCGAGNSPEEAAKELLGFSSYKAWKNPAAHKAEQQKAGTISVFKELLDSGAITQTQYDEMVVKV